MKKYYFLLILFNFTSVFSQDYIVMYNPIYINYDMSDLHGIQNSIRSSFVSNKIYVKIVDNFPKQFNHNINILKKVNDKTRLGLNAGYLSTGGRIHYSDYSGEILNDQILSIHFIGIILDHKLSNKRLFNSYLNIKILGNFSSLEINQKYTLLDDSVSEQVIFKSNGVSLEPSLSFEFFYRPLILRLSVGFHLNFNESFHLDENPELKLSTSSSKEIQPSWGGPCLGLSIGLASSQ